MRPRIVGEALQHISADPEVLRSLFDILETQKIIEGEARITLIPARNELIAQLLAAEADRPAPAPVPPVSLAALTPPARVTLGVKFPLSLFPHRSYLPPLARS